MPTPDPGAPRVEFTILAPEELIQRGADALEALALDNADLRGIAEIVLRAAGAIPTTNEESTDGTDRPRS